MIFQSMKMLGERGKKTEHYINQSIGDDKSTQKFPFTLNNKTYFCTESYNNDNQLINGINVNLRMAKGISNNEQKVSYLQFSHKLVYCAGSNIITYCSYKKYYELISSCNNLIGLRAMSLSTYQKEYIMWLDLKKNQNEEQEHNISVQDMSKKQKIISVKMQKLNDVEGNSTELICFMHPIKAVAVIINDNATNSSKIILKKKYSKNHNCLQYGKAIVTEFPFQIKNTRYDLETNSYFFLKNKSEICSLSLVMEHQENNEDDYFEFEDAVSIHVETVIRPELQEKQEIVQICLNQTYLVIMINRAISKSSKSTKSILHFYSIFTNELIFQEKISNQVSFLKPVFKDENEEIIKPQLIKSFEFSKNVLIIYREKSSIITIYSLFDQSLNYIRDINLDLNNCFEIVRLFINPLSSEVLILSWQYQLEGTLTAAEKSCKRIIQKTRYKSFFLEISSFFITVEASKMNIQRLYLNKRKYCQILVTSWMSRYFIQSENSIIGKNFEQKFDNSIKCSAYHPLAIYLALGFNDCFKVYFVNFEKLQHTYITQNMKECSALAYTKGGNQLAAATSHLIFIYDSYSFLKKHQICLGMMYRIEQLYYTEYNLHCLAQNKRIIVFNSEKGYREEFSFNPKSHFENKHISDCDRNSKNQNTRKVNSLIFDESTNVVIFSIGKKIHFICGRTYQSLGSFDFYQVTCMQFYENINTLFLGTSCGKIIAFPWPNKPANITSHIPTYKVHGTSIRKIRMSSNMFNLVSITEESMYVHVMSMMKDMRKIEKYELQRELDPRSILALDFFYREGICLFSNSQYNNKLELVKQIEQQSVNLNFILPEERQRQKKMIIDNLNKGKENLAFENQQKSLPYKVEAINMKQEIKGIEIKRLRLKKNFNQTEEQEVRDYRNRIRDLGSQRDELNQKLKEKVAEINKILRLEKEELRKIEFEKEKQCQKKIQALEVSLKEVKIDKQGTQIHFQELPEIEAEKKAFHDQIIKNIQNQIVFFTERNGYLICRNGNVQKEIRARKQKIQEMKDVIVSIKKNIAAFPRKKELYDQIAKKDQEQIMKLFTQTQKKYLKETKFAMDKDKAVNISLEMYEKEKKMLKSLEVKLEEEESGIHKIIEYLQKERQNLSINGDKVDNLKNKVQEVTQEHQKKIQLKNKYKSEVKTFIHKLYLFFEGVSSLKDLRKLANIPEKQKVKSSQNYQASISEKKKRIEKILSSQEKTMNVMKNDRKIFSNEKKKIHNQNQDLLVNFNFLTHNNKELAKIINHNHKKKLSLRNFNFSGRKASKERNLPSFSTIFRMGGRMKTSPCVEFQL